MAAKRILLCKPSDVTALSMSNNTGYISGNDEKIKQKIAAASIVIQNALGRKLKVGPAVDLISVPVMRNQRPFRVWLSAIPVQSITVTGKFSETRLWDRVDYLPADTIDVIDPDRGVVDFTFWTERASSNGLRVEYTGGFPVSEENVGEDYELLDVPFELSQACAIQANFDLERQLSNSQGSDSAGGNQQKTTVPASIYGVVPDAWKLISHLRRPQYRGV